jgi:hypothetical protein
MSKWLISSLGTVSSSRNFALEVFEFSNINQEVIWRICRRRASFPFRFLFDVPDKNEVWSVLVEVNMLLSEFLPAL